MTHGRAIRGLETAGFALVALAGAALLVESFTRDGILVGGSACGGAGAGMACRSVDRTLSVARDFGWFSVVAVAVALALVGVGVLALARRQMRTTLAFALLGLAFAGLVGTEHVESRFCPGGDSGGTCGRSDAAWGPVLRPPLLELRTDGRRELVGRPAAPGGPAIEADLTLDSFRAEAREGWSDVHRIAVGLWFLALAMVLPRFVGRPWQAALAVVTIGISSWAVVVDQTHPCTENASECFQGLVTATALIVSAVLWAAALAVAAFARYARRRMAG